MKLSIFILCLFFSLNSVASFFDKKPQEINTFQEIFSTILRSKKAELPANYSRRSDVINEHGRDTVYSVQGESCSLDDIFQAKVINVEVEGKKEDWVVFACHDTHDAVSFIRYGEDLVDIDSKSLIDLSLNSEAFNIEENQHFGLDVDSVNLKLDFSRPNHYQKVLTIEREIFVGINKSSNSFKVFIRFAKSEYQEGEIRWEYDFTFEGTGASKKARFLTVSKPASEDEEIYTHYRYFNGKYSEPIEYLGYFESLKKMISEIGKKQFNVFPGFPLEDQ